MNQDINQLFLLLSYSKFRSSFHLKEKDYLYIKDKGFDKIEEHARDFVRNRLAPAVILNDGKQTPYRGHPVFIAQHATATCCRSCLSKWHHLEKGVLLTEKNQEYIVQVLMKWIYLEYQKWEKK